MIKEVISGFLAVSAVALIGYLTGRVFSKKAERVDVFVYVFKGIGILVAALSTLAFFHAIGAMILH